MMIALGGMIMAAQKQTKTQDSILDQLDEINDALDEKETKEKIKDKQAPVQKEKNKRYLKFLLFAGLGVCFGLCANAFFTNHNLFGTNFSNGPKEEREYTDEEATAIYDKLTAHTYQYGGSAFTSQSTLSSFQKAGWVIQSEDVMPVELEPGAEYKCKLVKGSDVIDWAYITNNSKINYTTAEVPLDEIDITDTANSIVCPYGLRIGMSEANVIQTFADNRLPYSYLHDSHSDEYSSYVSRYTGELPYLYASMYINVNTDTGMVDYISFTSSTGSNDVFNVIIYD